MSLKITVNQNDEVTVVNSDGGGNPNYVETIIGTLDNPWGDVTLDVLADDVLEGNATVYLEADGTALGLGTQQYYVQLGGSTGSIFVFGACAHGPSNDSWSAGLLRYNKLTKDLTTAVVLLNGITQDLASYASLIPTELTIIYHPLPD